MLNFSSENKKIEYNYRKHILKKNKTIFISKQKTKTRNLSSFILFHINQPYALSFDSAFHLASTKILLEYLFLWFASLQHHDVMHHH